MHKTARTVFSLVAFASIAALASACAEQKYVLQLSEERRVWVVKGTSGKDAAVYRCADGSGPDQPPKPVCIRAPLVETPE